MAASWRSASAKPAVKPHRGTLGYMRRICLRLSILFAGDVFFFSKNYLSERVVGTFGGLCDAPGVGFTGRFAFHSAGRRCSPSRVDVPSKAACVMVANGGTILGLRDSVRARIYLAWPPMPRWPLLLFLLISDERATGAG